MTEKELIRLIGSFEMALDRLLWQHESSLRKTVSRHFFFLRQRNGLGKEKVKEVTDRFARSMARLMNKFEADIADLSAETELYLKRFD